MWAGVAVAGGSGDMWLPGCHGRYHMRWEGVHCHPCFPPSLSIGHVAFLWAEGGGQVFVALWYPSQMPGPISSPLLSAVSPEPPRFIKEPKDQIGVSGGVASFVCQATGDPKPRVTWNKKGKKVNSQRFEVSWGGERQPGVNAPPRQGHSTSATEDMVDTFPRWSPGVGGRASVAVQTPAGALPASLVLPAPCCVASSKALPSLSLLHSSVYTAPVHTKGTLQL